MEFWSYFSCWRRWCGFFGSDLGFVLLDFWFAGCKVLGYFRRGVDVGCVSVALLVFGLVSMQMYAFFGWGLELLGFMV